MTCPSDLPCKDVLTMFDICKGLHTFLINFRINFVLTIKNVVPLLAKIVLKHDCVNCNFDYEEKTMDAHRHPDMRCHDDSDIVQRKR